MKEVLVFLYFWHIQSMEGLLSEKVCIPELGQLQSSKRANISENLIIYNYQSPKKNLIENQEVRAG